MSDKSIICRNCRAVVSADHYQGIKAKCPKCGRKLLPGKKLEDRIIGLIFIIGVPLLGAFVVSPIKSTGLRYFLYFILLCAGVMGWVDFLGIISKRERYEKRADYLSEEYPIQAIDDYSSALSFAKESDKRWKILAKRAMLYEKNGMLEKALKDYELLSSAKEEVHEALARELTPFIGQQEKMAKEKMQNWAKEKIREIESKIKAEKSER